MADAAMANGPAWVAATTQDGRTYFYNKFTKQTTWEKPDELKTAQERDSVWKEYSKNNRPYWYNTVTKKTTWTRPDAMGPGVPKPEDRKAPSVQPAAVSPAERQQVEAEKPMGRDGSRPERLREASPRRSRSRRSRSRAGESYERRSRRDFQTVEEAEAAFQEMLKRHKVGGEWTWEQALRTVMDDGDYRALRTLAERKEAFRKYTSVTREEEREQRRRDQKQQREGFFALLDTLPLGEYSRFRRVRLLAGDKEAFRNVPRDVDRKRLFAEYMEEYRVGLAEERRRRGRQVREVAEFLGDIPVGSKWEDVKRRLVDRFEDQMMPILRVGGMPMDSLYWRGGEGDPEAGLSMLDLMDVFERAISDAEQREADKRKQEKAAVFREERQNRAAFRELLGEHSAKFTPSSTWTELYPQIKHDPRYQGMLGQGGSSPLELFWDAIEVLSDDLYRHRKRLEGAMREQGFVMRPDTSLEEVRVFAVGRCEVSEVSVEYIYQQLVLKAKRREEEAVERSMRLRRRQLDDLRYALSDLEPALGPDSEWDVERVRIGRLREFSDVDDETACRVVFDQVVERQKELGML
ncbi:U1 snRNP protein [Coemansia sp. RSA 552]|nr:U1 snRNP protein [Coemansia sp. RSA 552]